MAAITGAVIAAGATAYAANRQSNAAEDAARAQQEGTDATIAEQRRQFDLARSDSAPWREAGQQGLTGLLGLLSDPNSIQDSQAYQWRLGQGIQSLDRSAAARGSLFSGGQSADLMRFGQGEASQEYGNQWNRLAGLAGVGQTVNSQNAALGANMAGNIGNALQNNANARASSYMMQGNNQAQMAAGLGGMFNNWYQQNSANNGGGTGWYLGQRPGPG